MSGVVNPSGGSQYASVHLDSVRDAAREVSTALRRTTSDAAVARAVDVARTLPARDAAVAVTDTVQALSVRDQKRLLRGDRQRANRVLEAPEWRPVARVNPLARQIMELAARRQVRGRAVEVPTVGETRPAGKVNVERIIAARCARPEIRRGILGSLLFLDDTQIRERPGRRSSKFDASGGDGNRPAVPIPLPFRRSPLYVPIPGESQSNEVGEWTSSIQAAHLPIRVPDSHSFGTAMIAFPLFLFDEPGVAEKERVIAQMRALATQSANRFKRGDSYNFWREVPGAPVSTTAPPHIPVKLFGKMAQLSFSGPQRRALRPLADALIDPVIGDWVERVCDPEQNPLGPAMLFNVPNDADDTAVVTAMQALHSREYDPEATDPYYRDPTNFERDVEALRTLEQYRDIGRTKSLDMDAWCRPDSGAYLTWLEDEDADPFATPQTGVIPSAVNVVDEVVNANAIFSMSLNGLEESDGFEAACRLVADSVDSKHWQQEGIYYGAVKMIFPYFASRAYRDGGADGPIMHAAMKKLLVDVLEYQTEYQAAHPRMEGAFPPGSDGDHELATAFGVTFLLNVGREMAEEAGLGPAYDMTLEQGITFLMSRAKPYRLRNPETANRRGDEVSRDDRGLQWGECVVGAGDPANFAVWQSEAATASMTLEALAKYALAYDHGGVSVREGRRIRIDGYSRDAVDGLDGFEFRVE